MHPVRGPAGLFFLMYSLITTLLNEYLDIV
jgi:hypothetical protein